MTQPLVPPPAATSMRPTDHAEQVYFDGPPQLRGQVGGALAWWAAGIVLIAAPILLRRFTSVAVPWWAYLGGLGIGLVLFAVPVLALKTVRYRISNYRIDVERGLIGKTIDTLELWHVEDLRFHQSPIDRIMGAATITVLSHDDTTPQLVLHGLPSGRALFQQLEQRVIAVKRQRGVIKTDSGT